MGNWASLKAHACQVCCVAAPIQEALGSRALRRRTDLPMATSGKEHDKCSRLANGVKIQERSSDIQMLRIRFDVELLLQCT